MQYRADVDGLRAFAIIPVILFHAGVTGFTGGYMGVDIFFVISGYLISSILLADLQKGEFSLKKFYERRARRILPALFFVIAVTTIIAGLIMPPSNFEEYAGSAIAAVLSVSNILFWKQADYFNSVGELKPLLHTWSLGIEEQFYIFFPIGLFLIWKFAKPYLELLLIAGFLVSFAVAEWMLWRGHVTGNFYLLPSRGWELIAGGYVAYRELHRPFKMKASIASLLSMVGLGMVVASIVCLSEKTPHPGFLTMLPVIGAALILAFGPSSKFTRTILSNRIPVMIGLMSYSLYLWHQPVFALYRYYALNSLTGEVYAGLILLSGVLAYFTYKYVETPFRNRAVVSTKSVWAFSASGAGALILASVMIMSSGGVSQRFGADYATIFASQGSKSEDLLKVDGRSCFDREINDVCVLGDTSKPSDWALVGDSHAGTLGVSLNRDLKNNGISALFLSQVGCAYIPDEELNADRKKRCAEYTGQVHDRILQPDIKNIILMSRYVGNYTHTAFDNGEGGRELGFDTMDERAESDEAEAARRDRLLKVYKQSVLELLDAGKTVYLVYPVPEVGWFVPNQMFKRKLRGLDENITTNSEKYYERSGPVLEAFNSIPDHKNLHRILPEKMLCDSVVPGRCVTQLNGNILYFDDDHLSVEGADLIVGEVLKAAHSQVSEIMPAAGDTY